MADICEFSILFADPTTYLIVGESDETMIRL